MAIQTKDPSSGISKSKGISFDWLRQWRFARISAVVVADCIYHCIPIPCRKISQSRIGYMKLSLGLKKLLWGCMLQHGSRGSCNQSLRSPFLKVSFISALWHNGFSFVPMTFLHSDTNGIPCMWHVGQPKNATFFRIKVLNWPTGLLSPLSIHAK